MIVGSRRVYAVYGEENLLLSLHESTVLIGCILSSEPRTLTPGFMTAIEQMWVTERMHILPLKSDTTASLNSVSLIFVGRSVVSLHPTRTLIDFNQMKAGSPGYMINIGHLL